MALEMIAAFSAVFVFVFVWLRLRRRHIDYLRSLANAKITRDPIASRNLAKTLSWRTRDKAVAAKLGTYSSMTAAEFVWHWGAIDPDVIKAAVFSRKQRTIHNGLQFARCIQDHYDALGTLAAKEGFLNRLLGYLEEQQVADILKEQGHVVQVAATVNQPIWDLLIDSHSANVKPVLDIASIGRVGGAFLDCTAAEAYKQRPLQQALEQMERSLSSFGESFKDRIGGIRDHLYRSFIRMGKNLGELTAELYQRKKTWLWLIWPDFYTVLLEEAVSKGDQHIVTEGANVVQVDRILNEARQAGYYIKVGLLMANSPVARERVGCDTNLLEQVKQAQQNVFYQRKQFNPEFAIPGQRFSADGHNALGPALS